MPVSTAAELISTGRCSEMDIVLDLWLSTVYNDEQIEGSEIGPVVYLRDGTGNPLVSYKELAARWGLSKSTVGRVLKKLVEQDYISLLTFPGRHGSVIYLQNFLSTMFQVSDVMIDKEEVAMVLNIKLELPEHEFFTDSESTVELEVCVSDKLVSVSKQHIQIIVKKMTKVLSAQGISCFECPKCKYKLYPLSDDCQEEYYIHAREGDSLRFGLAILCGDRQVRTFVLTLSPYKKRND